MATKTGESLFDGFDSMLDIMSNPGENNKATNLQKEVEGGNEEEDTDSKVDDNDLDEEEIFEQAAKAREEKTKTKSQEKVEEQQKQDVKVEDSKQKEDISDIEEDEATLIEPFVDLFTQELGWTLDDEEKPQTIKDLVEYMQDIIETNSKPEFANDEVEQLNEFVKNGGDIKDFYQKTYSEVDVNNIDLDDEKNQKRVIRELLEEKGFNKTRIDRMISRYEDSDNLLAEAEDAIEELKELQEQRKQELLEIQKEENNRALEERRQFYTKVEKDIKDMNAIKGYDLTKKDKQELIDYIFRVESDGTTKYQKDYAKTHMNLIESAFFTMKGDKLLKTAETKGSNNATQMLKERLRSRTNLAKNTASIDENEASSFWDAIDSAITQPKR